MHHMVSIGNSRGYRLKGDWHDTYHLLANDNKRTDISLPDYKYQGIDKRTPGSVGNANSKIKNSAVDFDFECRRLLNTIHYFDVLRSDRSISSNGLEARTPFLDRSFVQTYLSIPPDLRFHAKKNKCEKYSKNFIKTKINSLKINK